MKKFIVVYNAPEEFSKKMKDATPEQPKAGMEPWMKWMEKVGSGMVDMGSPLGNGQKVTTQGTSPSTKNVVGYSILQAENMKMALELVKSHPHLDWDASCEVEIYESMPLPGQ